MSDVFVTLPWGKEVSLFTPKNHLRRNQICLLLLLSLFCSLLPTISFQWVFLPEPSTRKKLTLPPKVQVDYRAACFCHRNLIDIGYVCSVCLSSEYLLLLRGY